MEYSSVILFAKLKKKGIILAASRHNKRAIQSELGADSHINPLLTKFNYSLAGADTPEGVAQEAKMLMDQAGVVGTRKDAVRGIEIIFSLPPLLQIDHAAYFIDCLEWTRTHFDCPLLSFDCHLDEGAKHAHAIILPLVGGKMNGSRLLCFGKGFQAHLENFHVIVGFKYGLKKPTKPLSGVAKINTAKAVFDELLNDPMMKSKAWFYVRNMITSNPVPFAEVLGIPVATEKLRDFVTIMTSKGKGTSNPNRQD